MKKAFKLFLVFLFLMSLSEPIFSHGTVIWPPSRIYNCYNNPSSPGCQPCGNAIYNWMGVLQPDTNYGDHRAFVPDGQIASGGNGSAVDFSCLDALSSDWSITSVDHGYIDVKWENTAPHKTQYFKVYITQLNWDPTKPLRWDDLIEIGHVGQGPPESFTTIRSFIPDSYAGKRAALVSIWQRDYNDSHEAFYSVSDILVNRGSGGCTDGDETYVTFSNDTDCTLQYYQNNSFQGAANSGGSYTANAIVSSEWESREISGELVSVFTITCDQTTYTSTGNCSGDGGEGCDGINTWSENTIYVDDDKVAYNGVEYEAKWWNKGKNPEQNSGPWEVWVNLGSCVSQSSAEGVSYAEQLSFTVFPNPVRNILNLEISNLQSSFYGISIKTMDGRTIETKKIKEIKEATKVNQSISLKDLPTGIYFIELTVGNKTMVQKVFVR